MRGAVWSGCQRYLWLQTGAGCKEVAGTVGQDGGELLAGGQGLTAGPARCPR